MRGGIKLFMGVNISWRTNVSSKIEGCPSKIHSYPVIVQAVRRTRPYVFSYRLYTNRVFLVLEELFDNLRNTAQSLGNSIFQPDDGQLSLTIMNQL